MTQGREVTLQVVWVQEVIGNPAALAAAPAGWL
jgi:hypothetical protein